MAIRELLKPHRNVYDRIGNRLGVGDGTVNLRMGEDSTLNQLTEHGGGSIRFAVSIEEPGGIPVPAIPLHREARTFLHLLKKN